MRTVIGVMGSGRPLGQAEEARAFTLGRLIAEAGWVLLTGGRDEGVMDAASRGARQAGGLVLGILPDDGPGNASEHLDVAVYTGMGDARNVVNVLSSRIVIALPGGAGTLSEVAHALNAGRPVITCGWDPGDVLRRAGGLLLHVTDSPEEAVSKARLLLAEDAS